MEFCPNSSFLLFEGKLLQENRLPFPYYFQLNKAQCRVNLAVVLNGVMKSIKQTSLVRNNGEHGLNMMKTVYRINK